MLVCTILLITMLLPLLGIPFLMKYFIEIKGKINKGMCIPIGLICGVFGYNFRFNGESQNDLTRYFAMIEGMNNQNISTIIKDDNQMLYIMDMLFYYVSRCKDVNILSFIVGFIDYSIIFYILFDVVNRYRILEQKNGKIHLIGMCMVVTGIVSPLNIICNVRCVSSYLLVGLAVYREFIQKKRNIGTILLYVFPLGLHISTILFIGIRLILPLAKKVNKYLIFIPIFFGFIIEALYKLIGNLGGSGGANMLIGAVNKAYYYLNWSSGGWATEVEKSMYDRLTRVYGSFFIIFVVMLYAWLYWKKQKTGNKISDFVFLLSVISIGCLNIKTGAFWRFETVVVIFSIEIFSIVIVSFKQLNKYLYFLYSTAGLMFVLNIVHMSRNALIGNIIFGFCITSPIKIIFQLLYGLYNII